MRDGAVLIEGVRVYDTGSRFHGERVDLLLDGGAHVVNPSPPPEGVRRIDGHAWGVSPGWADIGAGVGEPGFEQRETVASLQRAARRGGYTHVAVLPTTDPVVDDQSGVRALLSRAERGICGLSVIGALSAHRQGEHLAEFADMWGAGVQMFSDGLRPVTDVKLLQLALEYAAPLGGIVFAQPGVERLGEGGQVHEGLVSTALGLRGIPGVAEEIGLARDLALLGYAGGRLHVPALSRAGSVAAVHAAVQRGLSVTYGVAVANVAFDEAAVADFDSAYKLLPPLRARSDREALAAAFADGAPACLVSNHQPWEREAKEVEFAYAEFGAASLEVAFGLGAHALGVDTAVEYLGRRNRAFLGLSPATVGADDGAAELTFFSGESEVLTGTPRASLATVQVGAGVEVPASVRGTYFTGELALNHEA